MSHPALWALLGALVAATTWLAGCPAVLMSPRYCSAVR